MDDIKTVKVSADPAQYSTFVYGPVKIGKSTFVHKMFGDRVLMVMTEMRDRGLTGAKTIPINSWSEYLQLGRLLKKPEMKERFDVIAIDTVDNLLDMLNKYVADKYQESVLGEKPGIFGKDWSESKKLWNSGLQIIQQCGYTPYFIGHSQQKTIQIPVSKELEKKKNQLGSFSEVQNKGVSYLEFEQYQPDLPERSMNPINKMVDQILHLDNMIDENGEMQRVIHTRQSLQWIAGSTFSTMAPVVKLEPGQYKKALQAAIDAAGETNKTDDPYYTPEKDDNFSDLMAHATELGTKLHEADKDAELKDIVVATFGADHKLMDATPSQTEQLKVAIMKMEEAA